MLLYWRVNVLNTVSYIPKYLYDRKIKTHFNILKFQYSLYQ